MRDLIHFEGFVRGAQKPATGIVAADSVFRHEMARQRSVHFFTIGDRRFAYVLPDETGIMAAKGIEERSLVLF